LALASLAETSQQTFVSTSGIDASATCDQANPCRTFNTAVSRTENGGGVIALDSGEYGPIVANRFVSVIAAPGGQAQITSTSGDAINRESWGIERTDRNTQKPIFMRVPAHVVVLSRVGECLSDSAGRYSSFVSRATRLSVATASSSISSSSGSLCRS